MHIFSFYMALVDSVLYFAGGTWIPLLTSAQRKVLDDLQDEGARLILGALGRGISRTALLQEARILSAFARGKALSGLLAGKALARGSPGDPLCRAYADGEGSWCRLARKAIGEAGLNQFQLERDLHVVPHDHFFWWKVKQKVELVEEEATGVDLANIHLDSTYVYYPDGGARYGVGQAAFTRFSGMELDSARV